MPEAIYILCTLTCMACALMLWLGFRRTHARLLLWSSLCFIGLTITNLLLFLDLVIFPSVDLGPFRDWSALLAMVLLLFGLIWDSD